MIKKNLLILQQQKLDSNALLNMELLKEYAGLERACIYYQLLATQKNPSCNERVAKFQQLQIENKDAFFLYASNYSRELYHSTIDEKNLAELQKMRALFCIHKNNHTLAKTWFRISTKYIDQLNTISQKMLYHYITISHENYAKAKRDLFTALILWILLFLALAYTFYLINKLLIKTQEHIKELHIVSYPFSSHEAICITDTDAVIIKINAAFTRVTGYTEKNAIGKKANILKSGRHDTLFYENMWRILIEEGIWNGDVYNKKKNGEIHLERLSITAITDENGNTTNYIAQYLDISDIKNAQLQAIYQANHDPLTNLANRKLLLTKLHTELNRAQRHNINNAFFFIDLDYFKKVNDTYGHYTGDKVLIYVAQVLKKMTRSEDIIARISGDEFAIILVDIDQQNPKKSIENVAQKIINEISKEIIIDDNTIKIGCSIGIRLFPHADDTIDQIVKDADSAMYKAKNAGKGKFLFF